MGREFLAEAEALERAASERRVAYFTSRIGLVRRLLDVGCGNGYSVVVWRQAGVDAIGVDNSLYRLGRWIEQHCGGGRPFVLADAGALPFTTGTFDIVISSGMIEHVGVTETSHPYRIAPHENRDDARARVIGELSRVTRAGGTALIDCPNGAFPIDFWHGDHLGAFRTHRVPDSLLPTFSDFVSWAGTAGRQACLETVSGRLAFRQVGRRWWGRLLALPMAGFLRALDLLVSMGFERLPARAYPYLVVALRADRSAKTVR